MSENNLEHAEDDTKWQSRALPMMTRMLVGLTIFFFFISLLQLSYLHWNIQHSPTLSANELLPDTSAQQGSENKTGWHKHIQP